MTRFVMTWDDDIAPALTPEQAYAARRIEVLSALAYLGHEADLIEMDW